MIEDSIVTSWQDWDEFETFGLQFGACTINPTFFPKGMFEQDEEVSAVVLSLNGEYSSPCVEVHRTNEVDDEPLRFDVELIRKDELAQLRDQLTKFQSLVCKIDSDLPSGLESWLDEDETQKYYETGEL